MSTGVCKGNGGWDGDRGPFAIKRVENHRVITTLNPLIPVDHRDHRVVLKLELFRPRAHIGKYSKCIQYNNCQSSPAYT